MKSRATAAAIALIVVAWDGGLSAHAQSTVSTSVPTLVRIDGALKTATGEVRTGTVLVRVSMYEAKDGGTPLWLEQQTVTLDAAGRYAIFAGATLPDGLPQEWFHSGAARWLGIQAENEAEQPRIMFLTVPYALKAREADTLTGRSATDFVLAADLGNDVKAALKAAGVSGDKAGPAIAVADNYLAKFAGGTATGQSLAYDNGLGIGIGGTTTPQYKIDVTGNGRFTTTLNVDGYLTTPHINGPGDLLFDTAYNAGTITIGGNAMVVKANGRVGVGTPSPGYQLDVVGDGHFGTTLDVKGSGRFGTTLIVDGYLQTPHINGAPNLLFDTPNNAGDLVFGGSSLVLKPNGNIGIGTVTPSSRLDVNGNINVTGNINAKYQDVAEWVPTPARLEPGTVVVVDPSESNRVLPASRAYDTAVAGAVSRQPGLILGERGDGKEMVAQSGRVRVKADARYGAIKIGDLLVTSATPGYAMRSRPMKVGGETFHRPGTLLGKALEALPNGQGEILVLLTLQ